MSDFAKGNALVACGAAVRSGVLSSFHRRQINKGVVTGISWKKKYHSFELSKWMNKSSLK